ncbi:prepilin-type N-terminal cleavage/methylation domain-containing protein [bacterium]|nr:prepilin-type N-terminal cleavage/methylation domain-containing protein [bacterium]
MVKRYAFTMIELIFAIVIIAIAVISLPRMTTVLSSAIDSNIVQEAIFAATTELNQVTTANWDDNSIEAGATLARVIDTTGDCDNNTSSPRYRLRPGHIDQPLHRRCLDNGGTGASNANINANDSLDDMHQANYENIFINNTPGESGYKNAYTSKITITPDADFGIANNPDIKRIAVSIKNSDGDIITSLVTYSANIGEVDYYKRSY